MSDTIFFPSDLYFRVSIDADSVYRSISLATFLNDYTENMSLDVCYVHEYASVCLLSLSKSFIPVGF